MAQTSKLTQSSKSKTKDNQSVPKPPADDEEPLIADKEEKKEEKEAQRVAEEIKTETPDLEQQGKEKNIRSADSPSTSDDSK